MPPSPAHGTIRLRCPSCSAALRFRSGQAPPRFCPRCGAALQDANPGNAPVPVNVSGPPPIRRPVPEEPPPAPDPFDLSDPTPAPRATRNRLGLVAAGIVFGLVGLLALLAFLLSGGATSSRSPFPPATVEDVIRHPFWKRAPSRAFVNEVVDRLTAPGRHGYLFIDDEGHVGTERFISGRLPDSIGARHIVVGTTYSGDTRGEALATFKGLLDSAVAREKYDRKFR